MVLIKVVFRKLDMAAMKSELHFHSANRPFMTKESTGDPVEIHTAK